MNTEYSGVKFLKPIKFQKPVIDRIYEGLIDLSAVSVQKDAEQMKKLMTGIDTEDADESDDGEMPTCFGKYDDDEKDCLKCDYCDPCEVEANGSDDPDPDEDEDEPKEEIDPELEEDDDPEEDELEKQLKERARARAGKRTAQEGKKRTPAPKKDDDEDD